MKINIPPMHVLQAFEAAARLGSFAGAADEICVTHGAVSHQMKLLESTLGVELFTRNGRRVGLTDNGKYFAERIRTVLGQLGEAIEMVSGEPTSNRLTISMLPSFASRWLIPRLGLFMEKYPELEVDIQATSSLANFSRDEVSIALRFGKGNWPDLHAECFLAEEYFPVCSPGLNNGRLPKEPKEIFDFPLLRSEAEPWTPWLREAGLSAREPKGTIEFNDAALMLQAAVARRGIALARSSIAQIDLRAGTLVKLFDISFAAPEGNYVAWPLHLTPSPHMIAFRDWLFEQAVPGEQPELGNQAQA